MNIIIIRRAYTSISHGDISDNITMQKITIPIAT